MRKNVPRRIQSEGGVSERYCDLCMEEDGKSNETARDMVTVTSRTGGEPRRIAVCLPHFEGLGKPDSPYVVIAEPAKGRRPGSTARPSEHNKGKSQAGEINRTRRQSERYAKTQRGRLGE